MFCCVGGNKKNFNILDLGDCLVSLSSTKNVCLNALCQPVVLWLQALCCCSTESLSSAQETVKYIGIFSVCSLSVTLLTSLTEKVKWRFIVEPSSSLNNMGGFFLS